MMAMQGFVIIGKSKSGKTSLFKALTDRQQGLSVGYPVQSKDHRYQVLEMTGLEDLRKKTAVKAKEMIETCKKQMNNKIDAIFFTVRGDHCLSKDDLMEYTTFKDLWGEPFRECLVVVRTHYFKQTNSSRVSTFPTRTPDLPATVKEDAHGRLVDFDVGRDVNNQDKRKEIIEAIQHSGRRLQSTSGHFSDEASWSNTSTVYNATSSYPASYERRVLIIGKTGNGKSSLGNILLGKKVFAVGVGMSSSTRTAAVEKTTSLTVVDTPDIINLGFSDEKARREIREWICPFPDAILLTIRCDVRYTAEEYNIYRKIRDLWPNKEFCRRLVVAFTFGDRQDRDLKKELLTVSQEEKNVLSDARGRYLLFSNLYGEKEKYESVRALFSLMDGMDFEDQRQF